MSHALDLFFGFSMRPFVALSASAAIAVALTLLVATAGVPSWPVAVLAVQTLGLAGLAVLGRYVMGLVRQASPIRSLVRESNLVIAPEDLLYQHEHDASRVRAATGLAV